MRIFFITAAFALASSTAGMAGPVALNDAEMDNIVAGVGRDNNGAVWDLLFDLGFAPAGNENALNGSVNVTVPTR